MKWISMTDGAIMSKTVECRYGHRIKVEVLQDTPTTVQLIECPTCGVEVEVFAGDVRGIVPL